MAQARNWVFTLNNPTELLDFEGTAVTYAIYSEEVGDNGNYHFQGYIQMERSTRLAAMKKLIPNAHFEAQRARDNNDARNYCKKVGDPTYIAGPYEYGIFRSQGARMDLLAVKEALDNGATDLEIAEEHFPAFIRYHKSFTVYRTLKEAPRKEIHSVIVIYGSPGTGKTYWVNEMFTNVYWAQRPNNSAFYFENYRGEDAILFDDFYGWLPRDFLLRLCQPYECRLPYRGGESNCAARNIIFTSNRPIWKWYKDPRSNSELDISNLIRRVTHFIYFTGYKQYHQTTDYAIHRQRIEEDLNVTPILIE